MPSPKKKNSCKPTPLPNDPDGPYLKRNSK